MSVTSISAPAVTIHGMNRHRSVTIDPPLFLAPMEGITDPTFRDQVIPLGGVGAACSEFVRISVSALPGRVIRRYLGPLRTDAPIAVQLMAADERFVPETVHAVEGVGASWIDLNFGCPAPVVFNKCAGSALLAKPEVLGRIIHAAVTATRLPVSVKMRAGITSSERLGDCLLASAEAGAAMITLHARLRCDSYSTAATWSYIASAKQHLRRHGHTIPLIGNGGIDCASDVQRMRDETGCDGVMIGRAALADPWIFSQAHGGERPTAAMAVGFALRYADAIEQVRGTKASLAKLKQLVRYFTCGDLFTHREEQRRAVLRLESLNELRAWFASAQRNQSPIGSLSRATSDPS